MGSLLKQQKDNAINILSRPCSKDLNSLKSDLQEITRGGGEICIRLSYMSVGLSFGRERKVEMSDKI